MTMVLLDHLSPLHIRQFKGVHGGNIGKKTLSGVLVLLDKPTAAPSDVMAVGRAGAHIWGQMEASASKRWLLLYSAACGLCERSL